MRPGRANALHRESRRQRAYTTTFTGAPDTNASMLSTS